MEWSQELCLKFIEDYRQYPELWRILDTNYKNKLKRNEALKELADKYVTSLKTVLNKIKSLRSYFHKEHSKMVKKRRESVAASSSSADEGAYVSNWFAYKSLTFILENDLARSARGDLDCEIANEDSDPACDEPGGEYEDACSTPEDSYPAEDGKEPSPSPAPKKTRKSEAAPPETYHCRPTAKKKAEERDEFAIFGEYIASKLRKMRDARLQSVVQNRITNMLFEFEMGLLGCPGPSSHPACRNSSPASRSSHSQSGGQLVLEPEITLVESNGANFVNFLSSVPSAGDCNSHCSNKPLAKRANHGRIMDSGLGQGALVLDCSIGEKR